MGEVGEFVTTAAQIEVRETPDPVRRMRRLLCSFPRSASLSEVRVPIRTYVFAPFTYVINNSTFNPVHTVVDI